MKKNFLISKFAFSFVILFSLFEIISCRNMIEDIDSISTDNLLIDSSKMVSITNSKNNNYNLNPYKIAAYETTYALWYEVRIWAEKNGFVFENSGEEGHTKNSSEGGLGRYKPVTTITCADCIVWCNAYSMKKGFEPCYYSDASFTNVIRKLEEAEGFSSVFVKYDASGFRLPTESEWKYAAYGAFMTAADKKYKFSGSNNLEEVAVAFVYSGPNTVGTKKPNGIGCYDMTGNVSEICFTNGKPTAWGGHCTNDDERYLKLPGTELYGIVKNYSYLFGFRIVQGIQ